jgi:hypothetical protein
MAFPAFPWGCEGHKTVALIAERFISPSVRAQAEALLKQFPAAVPNNPDFDCQPIGTNPIADASIWADNVRAAPPDKGGRPETGPWHFLDIPIGTKSPDPRALCPDKGCILTALEQQFQILKAGGATKERADALRYVIHFVGDLHQPLHATTHNDQGGNCLPIGYLDQPTKIHTNERGSRATINLHTVWDSGILKSAMHGKSAAEFAEELLPDARAKSAGMEGGSISDWILESFRYGEFVVYGNLPRLPAPSAEEVKQCTDGNLLQRNFDLGLKISPEYEKAAEPIVRLQIERAGVRLGRLLNEGFASSK